jgi:hypothetical protein
MNSVDSHDENTYNKVAASEISDTAYIIGAEATSCERCDEDLLFAFQDSNGRDFTVGIKDVLTCVAFAVEQGFLPMPDEKWRGDVSHQYGVWFHDNGE